METNTVEKIKNFFQKPLKCSLLSTNFLKTRFIWSSCQPLDDKDKMVSDTH